jgi:hypothetical protein
MKDGNDVNVTSDATGYPRWMAALLVASAATGHPPRPCVHIDGWCPIDGKTYPEVVA